MEKKLKIFTLVLTFNINSYFFRKPYFDPHTSMRDNFKYMMIHGIFDLLVSFIISQKDHRDDRFDQAKIDKCTKLKCILSLSMFNRMMREIYRYA